MDDYEAEHRRLLEELERLEREQKALDLRDRRAIDEWQKRIADLRDRISRHQLRRGQ